MKTYGILGMGLSGRAVTKYLLQNSHKILCFDKEIKDLTTDPDFVGQALEIFRDDETGHLSGLEVLIVSPGIGWEHPLVKRAISLNISVMGEAQFALQKLRGNKIIGVTGTNGKTTATMLLTHVLNATGRSAVALGNVGYSLSSYLLEQSFHEYLVVELSSYQLEDLMGDFLDYGAVINISPDHLNRYASYEKYKEAKSLIQNAIKPDGHLFLSDQAYGEVKNLIYRPYKIVDRDDNSNKLLSQAEQVAYCICKELAISDEEFLDSLSSFEKPSHRLECVAESSGVKFYNDSKATNAEATIHAVESLSEESLLLIVGGEDKGLCYEKWNETFSRKVKKVYMIGEAAEKIEQTLRKIDKRKVSCLQEAVEIAYSEAKIGDAIVLSPGCSSFDQFRNYQHRGNVFNEAVQKVIENEKIGSISR